VTIDLGERGLLFALLRSEGFQGWAGGAMNLVTPPPAAAPGENSYAVWHERMLANSGVHELPRYAPWAHSPPGPPPKPGDPPSDYPMLVRFRDINDPTTVERVDPDNLTASFGQGVKLRRITVQLTKDAVTSGIEKRFVWWSDFRDRQLDGKRLNNSMELANNLNRLDLSRGAVK
jgi:hypothetical protein